VLFSPKAHERLIEDGWSAARARAAIAAIVADAEGAFDEGWPTHPRDVGGLVGASRRYRTVYLGNLTMAQQLLRHESPATTANYLHPTREDLDAALRALDG
jgi:hypothetical protein